MKQITRMVVTGCYFYIPSVSGPNADIRGVSAQWACGWKFIQITQMIMGIECEMEKCKIYVIMGTKGSLLITDGSGCARREQTRHCGPLHRTIIITEHCEVWRPQIKPGQEQPVITGERRDGPRLNKLKFHLKKQLPRAPGLGWGQGGLQPGHHILLIN